MDLYNRVCTLDSACRAETVVQVCDERIRAAGDAVAQDLPNTPFEVLDWLCTLQRKSNSSTYHHRHSLLAALIRFSNNSTLVDTWRIEMTTEFL